MKKTDKLGRPLCFAEYTIYDKTEVLKMIGDRNVYIWGAGQKGRGFAKALKRNQIQVAAFVDNDPKRVSQHFDGIPIISAEHFILNHKKFKRSYVFVASVDSKNKQIFQQLIDLGLEKDSDFTNIQTLSPFYPTIEISGVCNLTCIACPRDDREMFSDSSRGFMTLERYKPIINKIIREVPFTYLVDLYIWGEPTLNAELPDIIKYNNRLGIASGLSSNLNSRKHLERIIEANPSQLRVSISGYGPNNYEITHKGGNWTKIYDNLIELKKFKDKYNSDTLIEVYFHANKNNICETTDIRNLCNENGYIFHLSTSMVFPDFVMKKLEGGMLSPDQLLSIDLMPIPLSEMLQYAQNNQNKSCLLKRIVPVINWDGSVLTCCNYSYDVMFDNYLNVSLQKIIEARYESKLCEKCQKHSLHRYNDQVHYGEKIASYEKKHVSQHITSK